MTGEQILSVGIDIGTSTTQVIFSRLTLENTAGYFRVPHISIGGKEVVRRGEIRFTPLVGESRIDGEAVRRIVADEFAAAGIPVGGTRTGAVIITGEAARKENAETVLEALSGFAGDFVVSSAGPDMEAVLAGKGSGAWQLSQDIPSAVVNVDIGGGTSNAVCFHNGNTVSTGCVDIGGRQVRLSGDLTVTYLSESAREIARIHSIDIKQGVRTDTDTLRRLCAGMAEALESWLGVEGARELPRSIVTAGSADFIPPRGGRSQPRLSFSGGVADFIYSEPTEYFRYGDIGEMLGEAVRGSRLFSVYRAVKPRETIRATVIGAGTWSTSVSGSTIDYSEGLFPLKNIPVLCLDSDAQEGCFAGSPGLLALSAQAFSSQLGGGVFAVALEGRRDPDYGELRLLADSLVSALVPLLPHGAPLIVLIENDMAKALGLALRRKLGGVPLISLDGVSAQNYNFIDIGAPLMDGLVVPVVVKTLIFG